MDDDARAAYARAQRLRYYKRRFGIDAEEFDRMAEGGCALCGTARDLVLDHDHATGAIRGVLCRICNTAIALLGDDPAALRRALSYLESGRT